MRKKIVQAAPHSPIQVGKEPVVILPLPVWKEIEERLEDLEAMSSSKYQKRVQQARKEVEKGKLIFPWKQLLPDPHGEGGRSYPREYRIGSGKG